jgi:hypothetical protein
MRKRFDVTTVGWVNELPSPGYSVATTAEFLLKSAELQSPRQIIFSQILLSVTAAEFYIDMRVVNSGELIKLRSQI